MVSNAAILGEKTCTQTIGPFHCKAGINRMCLTSDMCWWERDLVGFEALFSHVDVRFCQSLCYSTDSTSVRVIVEISKGNYFFFCHLPGDELLH